MRKAKPAAAGIIGTILLLALCRGVQSQNKPGAEGSQKAQASLSHGRVSLAPKFTPGQAFRYHIVFKTTTAVSHTGLASDPQGPSSENVTWDATLHFDVLPAEGGGSGARLRMVYDKSDAQIRSDTFDPDAAATQDQYQKLEGKALVFAFDSGGKLTGITGLEGVVDSDTALQSARQWITQFVAGPGAPGGGVAVGDKWNTDQPADSLPIAGMVWRAASQYVRDEPCPRDSTGTENAAGVAASPEMCAVILADLNLIQPKVVDPTPPELLKQGIRTGGAWNGSGQSQTYISLRTGLADSITQTGTEAMDVTFSTEHLENLRYAGTVKSQSQITLEPAAAAPAP